MTQQKADWHGLFTNLMLPLVVYFGAMTLSPSNVQEVSQDQRLDVWDETLYAPTPGYFGQTPTLSVSCTLPSQIPEEQLKTSMFACSGSLATAMTREMI
ncbi:predicted protein [Coccidioides posadasii str. Silveira]|uniref:Predicted protein n=1 Tax=Coccidioides posadasii (strain RMSCC 757 / Silveira) TaxID=443226 RepID=E9DC40_COCPS|nr:predicted protein [Coccidioides posadasii str. Silveira]